MHTAKLAAGLLLASAASALAAPQSPMARTPAENAMQERVRRAHSASFDERGARFAADAPFATATPELRLRLTAWGRTGALRRIALADPDRTASRVDYDHGDVVERYRITDGGFEQQFVLAAPPPGEGDVVFHVAASGNVTCPPAGAAHRELTFSRPDGRGIRYGSATVLDASGRSLPITTSYDGRSRIELVVPEHFVRTASYPVVVDPVVGVALLVAPPTSESNFHPDVAYDADHDRYLATWHRTVGFGQYEVWGRLLDGDGAALTPEFVIGDGTSPSVTYSEVLGIPAFFVAYTVDGRIVGQMVDAATGALLLAVPVEVSQPGSPPPGITDGGATVSGNPTSLIVAWSRSTIPGVSTGVEVVVALLVESGGGLNVATSKQLAPPTGTDSFYSVTLPKYHVAEAQIGPASWRTRVVWNRWSGGDNDVESGSFRMRAPNPFSLPTFSWVDPAVPLAVASDAASDEGLCRIEARADAARNPTEHDFLVVWREELDAHALRMDMSGAIGPEIELGQCHGEPFIGAGCGGFTVGRQLTTKDILASHVLFDGTIVAADLPVRFGSFLGQAHPCASSWPFPATTTAAARAGNTSLLMWSQSYPNPLAPSIEARRFEPVRPTVSSLAGACPSTLGTTPTMSAVGEAVAGATDFVVRLDGAPPLSLAALLVGDQTIQFLLPGTAGCELRVGLPLVTAIPVVTDLFGNVGAPIQLPCVVPHGASLTMQWAMYAPGVPYDWTLSDGLRVDWSAY